MIQEKKYKHQDIIIHVGLPKTATTFLQYSFFPKVRNISWCKKGGECGKAVSRNFIKFMHSEEINDSNIQNLRDAISFADKNRDLNVSDLLISDENISLLQSAVWRDKRNVVLDEWLRRLTIFSEDIWHVNGRVRIMIGFRRQDQWLSSRYAESAKIFNDFCQYDFERRMSLDSLAKNDNLDFLRYDDVHEGLCENFGRSNVMVYFYENISSDFSEESKNILNFINNGRNGEKSFIGESINMRERNVLRADDNKWMLRGTAKEGEYIHLSDRMSRDILSLFEKHNRNLARSVKFDVSNIGYY